MAVPPAPDGDAGLTDSRPRSRTFRVALLGVLVVLLLVGVLASAGIAAWRAGRGGDAADVQRERDAVMAQARQFMLRVNTYGPDLLEGAEMPEYRELVTEVITPKFEASFTEGVTLAEQSVAKARIERTSEIFSVGVAELDDDKATALVAGSFTDSYPAGRKTDERVEGEPLPFRVSVELVRTDGEWLVDDFTPVTGEQEEATP